MCTRCNIPCAPIIDSPLFHSQPIYKKVSATVDDDPPTFNCQLYNFPLFFFPNAGRSPFLSFVPRFELSKAMYSRLILSSLFFVLALLSVTATAAPLMKRSTKYKGQATWFVPETVRFPFNKGRTMALTQNYFLRRVVSMVLAVPRRTQTR